MSINPLKNPVGTVCAMLRSAPEQDGASGANAQLVPVARNVRVAKRLIAIQLEAVRTYIGRGSNGMWCGRFATRLMPEMANVIAKEKTILSVQFRGRAR